MLAESAELKLELAGALGQKGLAMGGGSRGRTEAELCQQTQHAGQPRAGKGR